MLLLWNLDTFYTTPIGRSIFRPARTIQEKSVALTGKMFVEYSLTRMEMNTYYYLATATILRTNLLSAIYITSGIGYCRFLLPFAIPFYRAFQKYGRQNNAEILTLPKSDEYVAQPYLA
jgi:hypothetical protein